MKSCPRSSGVEHFLGKEEAIGSNPIVGFQFWRKFLKFKGFEGDGKWPSRSLMES